MANNPKNTRKCALCRQHGDKSEMIRFVRVDGKICVDNNKSVAGRGIYVHKSVCSDRLLDKKALCSVFRSNVDPETVKDILQNNIDK